MTESTPAEEQFYITELEQQFVQLRHYDEQVVGLTKFALVGVSAIVGAIIGYYQFKSSPDVAYNELSRDLAGLGSIGVLLGLAVLSLVMRNRVNYVDACRNIANLRRKVFKGELEEVLGGVTYTPPPYWAPFSTHGVLVMLFVLVAGGFVFYTLFWLSRSGVVAAAVGVAVVVVLLMLVAKGLGRLDNARFAQTDSLGSEDIKDEGLRAQLR